MGTKIALARYLWEISRELPGSWKQRKRTLSAMARSIRDYISEGSCITYEQLVSRFGDPKRIAFTYVNELETDEIITEINISRKKVRILAITALVVIFMWAVVVGVSYYDHKKDANGYAVIEIIEYERIEMEESK